MLSKGAQSVVITFPTATGRLAISRVPALWMVFDLFSWAREQADDLRDATDNAKRNREYLDTAALEDAAGLIERWLDNPEESILEWPDLQMRQELGPPIITVELIDNYLMRILSAGETIDHEPLLAVNTLVLPADRKIISSNPFVAKHAGPDFRGVSMAYHEIQNQLGALLADKIEAVLGGMLLEDWLGEADNEREKNE